VLEAVNTFQNSSDNGCQPVQSKDIHQEHTLYPQKGYQIAHINPDDSILNTAMQRSSNSMSEVIPLPRYPLQSCDTIVKMAVKGRIDRQTDKALAEAAKETHL